MTTEKYFALVMAISMFLGLVATHSMPASGGLPKSAERSSLAYYSTLAGFHDNVGLVLPAENFEVQAIDANDGAECTEPLNSQSNDHCASPGELLAGFSLTSSNGNGVVILGDQDIGQEGWVAGAKEFIATTIISFDDADITAVAMDVLAGLAGGLNVHVQFFDLQGSLIGSTQVSTSDRLVSEFIGVISSVPISRVELATTQNGGELIDNLRFGTAQDPIFQDRFEVTP